MQNLKLFYESFDQYKQDPSIHTYLETLLKGKVETFNVVDHRNSYDHNEIPEYFPNTDIKMPDVCWCDIPDSTNTTWPKLHGGSKDTFIAAGQDILKLTESDIREYNES